MKQQGQVVRGLLSFCIINVLRYKELKLNFQQF